MSNYSTRTSGIEYLATDESLGYYCPEGRTLVREICRPGIYVTEIGYFDEKIVDLKVECPALGTHTYLLWPIGQPLLAIKAIGVTTGNNSKLIRTYLEDSVRTLYAQKQWANRRPQVCIEAVGKLIPIIRAGKCKIMQYSGRGIIKRIYLPMPDVDAVLTSAERKSLYKWGLACYSEKTYSLLLKPQAVHILKQLDPTLFPPSSYELRKLVELPVVPQVQGDL